MSSDYIGSISALHGSESEHSKEFKQEEKMDERGRISAPFNIDTILAPSRPQTKIPPFPTSMLPWDKLQLPESWTNLIGLYIFE